MSRRTLLTAGALAMLGVATWSVTNLLDAAQGGVRRFTGSRWLPPDTVPPPTTFFGEGTPAIDLATWRLRIRGKVAAPLELTLGELDGLGVTDARAVLDCTSGWVVDTRWSGVVVGSILDRAGVRPDAESVTIRSVTGWYANLPVDEARRALLATGVAGQALPAGNGAPLRLVAPDRRGLEWVKWVTEIDVG